MKSLILKYKLIIGILVLSFVLYFPSLFVFYTNDDFFHLQIARATNLDEFVNFFNLTKGSGGQLLYRPLTTHVFYFLGWSLFNLNPIGLHIVSYILFFIAVVSIYKISKLLSESEFVSILTTFLYATSASHFGHLYYLATELVLSATFFPTIYFYVKFLISGEIKYYAFTFIMFVLSILAKENSVVLPAVFGIVYLYLKIHKKTNLKFKQLIFHLIPYVLTILIYLYFHYFYYGFVTGDTYVWDFSIFRVFNTIAWYIAWGLNIPEMFLDFVGSKLKINQNLFIYWGNFAYPILLLFLIEIALITNIVFKAIKQNKDFVTTFIFSSFWFIVTLSPLIFFPEHKFSFYLTLPLFGIVYFLAKCFNKKQFLTLFFISTWLAMSVVTQVLSYRTNWITQGQMVARNVDSFFRDNRDNVANKQIYFVDTIKDKSLPWSPTEVVKVTLSDKNYFHVFFPEISNNIHYYGDKELVADKNNYIIESRQFLGY